MIHGYTRGRLFIVRADGIARVTKETARSGGRGRGGGGRRRRSQDGVGGGGRRRSELEAAAAGGGDGDGGGRRQSEQEEVNDKNRRVTTGQLVRHNCRHPRARQIDAPTGLHAGADPTILAPGSTRG